MAELDLFKLAGKRALVVGGGLGMGRASAELLASVGVAVTVLDVEERRARWPRNRAGLVSG
jgi:3-oxoacyl-[acyl-carrier protein] reductase